MSQRDTLKTYLPKIVTAAVIVTAILCGYLLFQRYRERPWTRDGQVRADVVNIAPRVSGYLTKVAVQDNQAVKKGDLLFQIDPSSYQLAVDQANVALVQAREEVAELEAAVRAAEATVTQNEAAATSAKSQIDSAVAGIASAEAQVKEAEAEIKASNASIEQVKAQLEEAEREAERAEKLAEKKAGSVQTAESKRASVLAYEAEVKSAEANLSKARASLDKSKAAKQQADAALISAQNGYAEAQAAVQTATADLDQAKAKLGEPGELNSRIKNAQVQLESAELNLNWTSIYAPADGYVTNMRLLESTFVAAGSPFALFVDTSSFRIDAYFQETKLKNIKPGDRALITLMSHSNHVYEAEVESIGYAINPPNLAETDGPNNLTPTIQPTFDWIRLAQRVPVRVRFKEIPTDVHLVSGMTASVSIQK